MITQLIHVVYGWPLYCTPGWCLNWWRSFPGSFPTLLTSSVLYTSTGLKGIYTINPLAKINVNTILFTHTVCYCPSPLPLNLLSEMAQHLTKLNLPELISSLPLHLQFIKHAAAHPQINPVVSCLEFLDWIQDCHRVPWEFQVPIHIHVQAFWMHCSCGIK